jgi:parallel beta-helix repeat protein
MTRIDVYPGNPDDAPSPLVAARDELRTLRADGNATGPVDIAIHAGTYALDAPLELTAPDFGTADSPVTWRAAGDGEVVITGTRRVTASRRSASEPASASVEPGLAVTMVMGGGRRLRPARYPAFEPENPYFGGFLYADTPPEGIEPTRHRLWSRDPGLTALGDLAGAELVVFPRHNYRNNHRPIAGSDPETGEIRLAVPTTYEIDPGDRFYVQHVKEALSAPGTWHADAASGQIQVIPPDDRLELELDVVVAEHLIVIRGERDPAPPLTIDGWPYWDDVLRRIVAPDEAPAAHLTIRGLTLEGCTGTGIQVESVAEARIEACTVRHAGGYGIAIVGGRSCQAVDCEVSESGQDGVVVAGGLRRPFNVIYQAAGHRVSNCYVHHIGLDEKHVAGISISGVGNTISHCLIHDAPRWGILSRGNDHLIEYTHIRHVNIETSDTAGIDLCDRDFTMHGTVIRYNRIHDILGYSRTDDGWISPSYAFGIYLDDWTSGNTVHGNLTYNTPRAGIYLNSGHSNVVTNNCCLAGAAELGYYNRWSAEMEHDRCGTYDHSLRRNRIEGNILVSPPEGTFVYGLGRNLTASGETDVATNTWNRNLIWNHGHPLAVRAGGEGGVRSIPWEEWTGLHGQDRESVVADPLLGADYALPPESPALALGFEPLPIDEMGIQPGGLRPDWPPREADGVREYLLQAAHGQDETS